MYAFLPTDATSYKHIQVPSNVMWLSRSTHLDHVQIGSSCTTNVDSDRVHQGALGKGLDLDRHGG